MSHYPPEETFSLEPYKGSVTTIVQRMLKEMDERFDYHKFNFQGVWGQTISRKRIECIPSHEPLLWDVYVNDVDLPNSDKDWTLELQFPSHPPKETPVVKAQALSEPLKVRMITAAESETKVLQPFQKALWNYLSEQPQFCLTNGVKAPWSEHESFEDDTLPWIYRIETMIQEIQSRTDEDFLWLSGDYTAATDNFPMSVTEALIEGILSEIDHKPTQEWVRWECSSHRILYPKGKEGHQTSGQLMGSLLSFPLLCFLNDYIVSYSGFTPYSYLINGDDVVARGSMETIEKWRNQAPQVGLSLSLGKNFIDPDFCTVNSQLFYNGRVLHTGKVSCQSRVGVSLSYCFEETQFYWGTHDWVKYEFLKRNLLELRKTPRSLHLGKKWGGLGLVNSLDTGIRYDHGLMKEVYLRDLLSNFEKSQKIPGTTIRAVPIPVLRGEVSRNDGELLGKSLMNSIRTFLYQKEELKCGDLTHADLHKFRKRVNIYPDSIRDKIGSIIKSGRYSIKDFPPLDFIEVSYIFVQDGRSRFILDRARQHCLDLFERILFNPDSLHPFEWEGGELQELPDTQQEWNKIKEIFLDKNLLLNEPSDLSDLDYTEDIARWFNEVQEEPRFEGKGEYCPLPFDSTPIQEFLGVFNDSLEPIEQEISKNNDLPPTDTETDGSQAE
jgi:hypothetical protein